MNRLKETVLYVVRHGETKWNKEGKLQGWLDSALTENGMKQAEQLAKKFKNETFDAVFASDLTRAVETARLVTNADVIEDARLREIYLGSWQGQKVAHLMQQSQYETYVQSPKMFQPTEQESFEQVATRMHAFVQAVHASTFEKVLVVSHGVAIFTLLESLGYETFSENWQQSMLAGGQCVIVRVKKNQMIVEKLT